jgi:hypothetical protein
MFTTGDQFYNQIRKIVATGGYLNVVTVATVYAVTGLAVDINDNIYASIANGVEEFAADGNYATSVVLANELNSTGGITRDAAGNLYISESGGNRILELSQ